jgi:predicted nucleic acid-binding protein
MDVNSLIALIWPSHVHHTRVTAWRPGKALVLCPITELGFIRVSTSSAFNATMADSRQALADFIRDEKAEFIPADSRALDGATAPSSKATTDWYLANLATAHAIKLATLDAGITHSAAEQIP